MKSFTLSIFLSFFTFQYPSQTVRNDISVSYSLGKTYYKERDYFSAYKYLMIYKYSFIGTLSKKENNNFLISLDKALNYCEDEIKLKLNGTNGAGKGWNDSSIQTKNKVEKSYNPPPIPENNPIQQ